jgi:hypothetical protein
LRNYPWSSYRCYVERGKRPEWLTTAAVLAFLGEGVSRRDHGYSTPGTTIEVR